MRLTRETILAASLWAIIAALLGLRVLHYDSIAAPASIEDRTASTRPAP